MNGIFVGLGANLGDREANIRRALGQLNRLPETTVRRVSSLYDTDPVGDPRQDAYLNAVCELTSELGARDLLWQFLLIESRLGRTRDQRWGPRTIDLDLLLYGTEIIRDLDLLVPHPELHHRAFVLVPLAELVPDPPHPSYERTVRQLLHQADGIDSVRCLGRFWYQDVT